jgi:tetratricopeptide (TPR) repeat protein
MILAGMLAMGQGCANKKMGDKLVKKANKKPNDISLRLRAGDALMEEERFADAAEQYGRAIKLVEKNPKENQKYYFKSWNNKGVALYQLGAQSGKKEHFTEAIDIFKKMLEIPAKKKDSMLYSNIAHAYHGLGDFAEAEKWFQKAMQLNSGNENARKGYRILLDDMSKQAAEELRLAQQQAETLAVEVEAAPRDTALRLKLANLLVDLDRKDESLPHFEYILANADPADPDNREALLTANFFLENYEQALTVLKDMVVETPDDSMLYARMARCQHEMGQYGPALKDYEKALELDPKNPVALQGLADLQKKLSEPPVEESTGDAGAGDSPESGDPKALDQADTKAEPAE